MFRKILKSLAVATAITISLAGTALSAEPDLDEFRDEIPEGIVQLDNLEGKVSDIPAAEAGTSVALTVEVNNEQEGSANPDAPFVISENGMRIDLNNQGNYEVSAGNTVKIIASPKAGYYAYIGKKNDTSKFGINFYECSIDTFDIYTYNFTITFFPISVTSVDIYTGETKCATETYPDPFTDPGSDFLRLLDIGSREDNASWPKYKDINGDGIKDRLQCITVTGVGVGAVSAGRPDDPQASSETISWSFNIGDDGDYYYDNDASWEEFVSGELRETGNVFGTFGELGLADLTSVTLELNYTAGQEYTFCPQTGDEDIIYTLYPGDTLYRDDFVDGGKYAGILQIKDGKYIPKADKTGYTGVWKRTDSQTGGGNGIDRLLAGEADTAEIPEGNREYEIDWKANVYAVTLDANDGTITTDTDYSAEYTDGKGELYSKKFDPVENKWYAIYGKKYGAWAGNGLYQFPVPKKTGYNFQGWFLSGKISEADIVRTASDHTLTAKWDPTTYKITYDLNCPSGTVQADPLTGATTWYTVESGPISLPTPTRTGYDFLGWTWKNNETDAKNDTPTKDLTFQKGTYGNITATAKWTVDTYTITLKGTNAKFEDGSTTKQYTIEDEITLPQPTRSGYTFTGWTGTGLNAASTVVTIEKSIGDRTYTATWRGQEYTINIYPNYGSNRVPDTNDDHTPYLVTHPSYRYLNSKQMLSEFPGYKFLIWKVRAANDTTGIKYSDADGTEYKDFKQVRSSLDSSTNTIPNLNIYAVWTPNTLTARPTLTPSDGGTCTDVNGNTVSPTTGYTLTYGTNQALTFKANKGFKIAKVTITTTTTDGQTVTKEISVNGESYSFKYSDTSYPDGAQLTIAATFTDANSYSAEEYGWSFTNMQRAFWDSSTYAFPESRYAEVFGDGSGSSYYKAAVKNGTNKWSGSCAGMSLTSALFYMGKLNWDSYRSGFTQPDEFVKPNDFYDGLEKYGSSYIVKADRSNSADNPNDVRRLIEDYQIYGNTALTQGTDDDLIKNYYSYQINYSAGTLKYAHRSAGTYVSDTLDILRNAKDPMPIVFYGQYNDTGRTFGHMIVARTDIKPEDPDGDGWWNVYVYDPNYPVVDQEIIKKANQMAGGTDIGANRINPAKNVTSEDGKGRFMELNPSQNKWRYESSANATTGAGFIGCDKSGNVEYMDYTSGSWKVSCPDYYALRFLDGSTFVGDFRDRAYIGSPWMAEEGEAYVTVDGSVDCTIYDSDGKAVAIASDGNGMALTEDAVFTPYVGETAEDGGMAGGRFVLDGERFTVEVTEPGEVQFFGNDKVITAIPGGSCGLEADLATNTVSATASGESMDIRLKTANVYSSTSAAYALAEGTLGSGETLAFPYAALLPVSPCWYS